MSREAAIVALKEHLIASGEAGMVAAANTVKTDLALVGSNLNGGLPGETVSSGSSTNGSNPQAVLSAVHHRHFCVALQRMVPSVSLADERMYNALRGRMRQARSHLVPEDVPASIETVAMGPASASTAAPSIATAMAVN